MADIRRSKRNPKSYVLHGTYSEESILKVAESILAERIYAKEQISSPEDMKRFLALRYRDLKYEVFSVVFLNTQHEVLACDDLFVGTLDGASVYPREVVRKVIECNAAAVILAHNHPSGNAEPSEADRRITERLINALQLIDTRVLDHIVIAGTTSVSFAERCLL